MLSHLKGTYVVRRSDVAEKIAHSKTALELGLVTPGKLAAGNFGK